ncbi:MAG: signal peptide peptidase SppA [Candidatus Korarchaeota archaeon]|nr:signal peptide peptidase SppA [Candidatus Korarchaeota archaeon]
MGSRRGIAVFLAALILGVTISYALPRFIPRFSLTKRVALLELSGVISYGDSASLLGGGRITPDGVREMVDIVRSDPSYAAVVLVINSPGGSAAASEEIYGILSGLSRDLPVVAYIGEYGASGGYYVALAADEIVASPAALTGSVGAVSILLNYAGLAEKLGVKGETFKSGELKDVGNPWREMTAGERALMQSLIDSSAELFRQRVWEVRGDKIRDWEGVITARPYTGTQALEVGLVDRVGTLEDAVNLARRMAGLPEDAPAEWVRPPTPGLLDLLLGGTPSGVRGVKLSYELLWMWPLPYGLEELAVGPSRLAALVGG